MQKDFCEFFDNQTVETRDFTMMIKNIPAHYSKCNGEIDVKFMVWNEI
jgi:hypothetical protein